MDKILQSMGSREGGISVTNDGATILRSIHVDNAAAKVLVNIAKTQASACVCALFFTGLSIREVYTSRWAWVCAWSTSQLLLS